MSRLALLKSATSREDVAKLLSTSKAGLSSILYMMPISNRYTVFEIPKKGGGTRTIKAPDDKLKLVQEKLSVLLQDCMDEINLTKGIKHPVALGFTRKGSIIKNATRHRRRRWVFNLDLKDFFPSIHFGRVRGFFIKDKSFSLHPDVATVLAQIACDGTALPQGSPCSPVISNLIGQVLDAHIVRLARRVGCSYSRYADDLTFSTNMKEFPVDIAYQEDHPPYSWLVGKRLKEIITHSDFKVNDKKTRMQFRDSRQDVTGLIVNHKVNIPTEYRRAVRAMVHRLFRTGKFQVYGPVTDNGITSIQLRDGALGELHGRLGFIDGVDLHNKKLSQAKGLPHHLSTKESMFRQFLIYRDFYAAETPVILCEGKTDNIYLKHAIRSLALSFPDLAEVDANGNVKLKVRLYKYTKSSTGRILGLKDGGSSHLATFITTYKRDTDRFAAPGLKQPLIIVFDSDSGARPICAAAKQARHVKKDINLDDPFTPIIKNMYLVPTPITLGQKESKIEDLFDDQVKGTVLSGKTFSAGNNFDETKHYGKWVFAEKVIAPHAASIDFSGFIPLLMNISSALNAHVSQLYPSAP
jgi:retron-type reverse transcriptase